MFSVDNLLILCFLCLSRDVFSFHVQGGPRWVRSIDEGGEGVLVFDFGEVPIVFGAVWASSMVLWYDGLSAGL